MEVSTFQMRPRDPEEPARLRTPTLSCRRMGREDQSRRAAGVGPPPSAHRAENWPVGTAYRLRAAWSRDGGHAAVGVLPRSRDGHCPSSSSPAFQRWKTWQAASETTGWPASPRGQICLELGTNVVYTLDEVVERLDAALRTPRRLNTPHTRAEREATELHFPAHRASAGPALSSLSEAAEA